MREKAHHLLLYEVDDDCYHALDLELSEPSQSQSLRLVTTQGTTTTVITAAIIDPCQLLENVFIVVYTVKGFTRDLEELQDIQCTPCQPRHQVCNAFRSTSPRHVHRVR